MTVEKCVVCSGGLKENTLPYNKAIKWFGGHNPWPLGSGPEKAEGRACDKCNDLVVAARLAMHFSTKSDANDVWDEATAAGINPTLLSEAILKGGEKEET